MIRGKFLRKNLFIYLLSACLICLIFSKYVMSMSILGLICLGLFTKNTEHNLVFGINKEIFSKAFYSKGTLFLGFLLYFLWIASSVLWSENVADWFADLVGKASILGFAFIWFVIPDLNSKEVRYVHHAFFASIMISCLLILAVYIPQFDHITLRIGSGRPIPMPIDHVRFSMMVSYASLSSLSFAFFYTFGLSKKLRIIYLVLALVFFGFVHLLAVRSGIFLLYSGIALMILYFVLSQRKYISGIIGFIGLVTLPIIAYNTVPSFKNKVLYTKYDIQRSFGNQGANYSDGDRIRSIKNGLALWKNNPLLGLGGGDYKNKMNEFYQEKNQSGRQLLPHNQWIRSGMAYGIIGVILLFFAFLYSIWHQAGYLNILLLIILQLFFLSLIVESNMERYYALVFFFLFIGLNSRLKSSIS